MFSVGTLQESVAEPVAGGVGGGCGGGDGGVELPGDVAAAEAEVGDTLTSSPHAVSSRLATSRADSENRAFRGRIVAIERLNYGCSVHAICRRLRT